MATAEGQLDTTARAFAALAHPVRLRALGAFRAGERSAVELHRLFDDSAVSLGTVAYHVRLLATTGLIERTRGIPRRGAIESRYELSARGHALAALLDSFGALPD